MTRVLARWMGRALAVAAVLLGLPARAGVPGRLAVVELASPPSMVGLSAQVARALQAEARAQGYVVVGPEAVRATLGGEAVDRLHACRGSPECVALRASGLPAPRAVVGALSRDEAHYRLEVHLVDLVSGRELARLERPVLIAGGRFQREVEEALPALLRGREEARGTLHLTASVPRALVEVEGGPAGTTPLALRLGPGRHRVRVSKPGYWPVERLVTVEAGRTRTEQVRLTRQPKAHDAPPPRPAQPSAPTAPAARPSLSPSR